MIKLKLTEDGKSIAMNEAGLALAIDDEKPEGEQEFALDALHLLGKIPTLQNEAKTNRLAKEEAETKLKAYDGIPDAKVALEALEKVKSIDDNQLMDNGEVEKLKEKIILVENEKYDAMETNYKGLLVEKDVLIESQQSDIFDAMVSQRFSSSPFFSGTTPKSTMLPDVAKSYFGNHFKVEKDNNGKTVVIGYDVKGEKILSRTNPGDYAGFDECVETIINQHPQKESFLKPSTGTGSPGGGKIKSESESKRLAELPAGARLKEIRKV